MTMLGGSIAGVEIILSKDAPIDGPDLAPGWVAETIAIWTQFPARKGILDLTGRSIAELPEEIFRMRKLETLILNKNMIKQIPRELAKLSEAGLLRSIECEDNLLEEVDEEISTIRSLEKIRFARNLIKTFPSFVNQLYQLLVLDLSENQLTEIPGAVGNLLFLEELNISHNFIKNLPQPLMNLARLQTLNISHNQIERISPAIANLSRLKNLIIHDNMIEELPIEMGFLLGVENWKIENNPFTKQPEINEKQLYQRIDILNYLRTKMRQIDHLQEQLFNEKDNKYSSFFETVEGEDKPVLVGATPEKLVLFLTQVATPDLKTYDCLLLCYSYFIKPEDLLYLFFLRYKMNMSDNRIKKEQRRVEEIVRTRVIYGIEVLLNQFNEDGVIFTPRMSEMINDFIEFAGFVPLKTFLSYAAQNDSIKLNSPHINEGDLQKELRKVQGKQVKEVHKFEKAVQKKKDKDKKKFMRSKRKRENRMDRATAQMGFGLSHSSEDKHILLFSPIAIAMQITRLDSVYFNEIPQQDFLHQTWSKHPDLSGVTRCIEHFNNMCNWTITWIVKQHDIKTRLRTTQHILDIAAELFELGDFLALFAIASAMSGAAISRLKDTISLLDDRRRTLNLLEQLVDNTNNYRAYRDMRQVRIDAGHCVPQLALYLRDLTFMEDGNPNFLNESVDQINLGKFRLISRTVNEIESMKKLGYEGIIEPDLVIEKLILHTPRIDDSEQQYQQSLICEPRKRVQGAAAAVKLREQKENGRRTSLPSKLKLTVEELYSQSDNSSVRNTDRPMSVMTNGTEIPIVEIPVEIPVIPDMPIMPNTDRPIETHSEPNIAGRTHTFA